MNIDSYQQLNFRKENPSIYRHRLQAFAIAYRFDKSSHYIHVAEQIIRLNLISEFERFIPPAEYVKQRY